MRRMALVGMVLLGLSVYGRGAEQRGRESRPTLRKAPAAASQGSPADAAKPQTSSAPTPPVGAAPVPVWPVTMERAAVMPTGNGEHPYARGVFALRNAPAQEVAQTLLAVFRTEGQTMPSESARPVVIVPEASTNVLVVGGSPETVKEVEQLVRQLDRAPSMVRLEIVLGDVPGAKTGTEAAKTPEPKELLSRMESVCRAELTTLDKQPAQVQLGRREPRITSTQMSQHGQVNSVTYENVGTMMSLTPRIGGEGVVTMEVSVEDALAGPVQEGTAIAVPKEGEPVRVADTETFHVRTTLRVANGQTVALGGTIRPKSGKQRWVLITPHTLAPAAK